MVNKFLFLLRKTIPRPIFKTLQPAYHLGLAFLAAVFYNFPSRKMIVIGVTGTNGKSTVVELIHNILSEAGFKTGSVSSLRFKIGDDEKRNELKMTMPGRFALQKFLKKCVATGCGYAVLEVTSEGIKQFRHCFIDFSAAVLTNVTPEHIESHGSFEKYLGEKLKLFKSAKKIHVINADDQNARKFMDVPARIKYVYTDTFIALVKNGRTVRLPLKEKIISPEGISFKIEKTTFSSKLIGKFNLYNILAALCIGLSQEIDAKIIKRACEKTTVIPGRLEFIQREPFRVVVDYAHTPDALRKVYEILRVGNSKLICVLGSAGGGRDKWKRPEMGKIAQEFCQKIILTNEDPYDESPRAIIKDIENGFSPNPPPSLPPTLKLWRTRKLRRAGKFPSFAKATEGRQIPDCEKIIDRREAIREALKSAKKGDTVIITGKGAEPWLMGPQNSKIPWDDRMVVKEELQRIPQAGKKPASKQRLQPSKTAKPNEAPTSKLVGIVRNSSEANPSARYARSGFSSPSSDQQVGRHLAKEKKKPPLKSGKNI